MARPLVEIDFADAPVVVTEGMVPVEGGFTSQADITTLAWLNGAVPVGVVGPQ